MAAVQAALSQHLDEDEDLPMSSRRNIVPEPTVVSPSSSFAEENGNSRSSTPGTPNPVPQVSPYRPGTQNPVIHVGI